MTRTDFRKVAGTTSLKKMLGVNSIKDFNDHQRKAFLNFKYCANDAWQFVNDCLDHTEYYEESKDLMTSPKQLFDYLYEEALSNVYAEGFSSAGKWAESFIKDIRFCGKDFLQKLAFFYAIKDIDEAFEEVEGNADDEKRIIEEINEMKTELAI